MLSMMIAFFTNLGINSITVNRKDGMTSLNIEGVTAVSLLLPMLRRVAPHSYWKLQYLNLLLEFFKCYSAGIHTYREGVIALIKIIHKYPNKRDKSLEE